LEPQKPFTASRVLLVDDDPIIVRIYQNGLTRLGFEVTAAVNGLAAMQALRDSTPDVVVLDLMMPKFSGAEVLRFIRGRPETESVPVIILSNAYMDALAQDASRLGASRGLLKMKCTPASVAAVIKELLEGVPSETPADQLLAAPAEVTPPPETAIIEPVTDESSAAPPTVEPRQQARAELAKHTPAVTRSLRESHNALRQASDERQRKLRVEVFYRHIHFIVGVAGLAGYRPLAQMAAALEALTFGMLDRPAELSPSLDRTLSTALEFLLELLETPEEGSDTQPAEPKALVVDDDKLSHRLVVTALRNAHVQAKGTENPELALRWLKEQTYDLILLDVEMPGMDGLELCERLRGLPAYEKTPVIYVTIHSDFETRSKTLMSGGNDLIAKPIHPTELAVKAVMHLLKHLRATRD
jgi:CheY-like chemotaxis protein